MKPTKPMHGTSKAKGCSHMRLGNFCQLFPKLKSWGDDFDIKQQCEAEQVAAILGASSGIMHDVNSSSPDSSTPAGYTFFAQFIDHDITLDTTTALHGSPEENHENSPFPNLRSASLDLDCVYGFGPEAMPFMYDQKQPGRMLTGNKKNKNDVPRNRDGRALIGDPRNDENIFVSQMQLLFIRFHNRRMSGRSFEEAQTDVRYHYQWIVLHDFLRRICDAAVFDEVVSGLEDGSYPKRDLRDECGRICMPLEFSVAGFRFGHSLVRSQYSANDEYTVIDLFDERFGTLGFGHVPEELTIDWRFLLPVEHCHDYIKSKKFDHLLADELIRLPDQIVGHLASTNDRSLAFRNLLRAYALKLPSGQSVAKAIKDLGYNVDPSQDLKFDEIPGWKCVDETIRKKLEKHTPLFFYLMREASVVNDGEKMGPVGSAILLEVFGNMLVHCKSFLNDDEHKNWQPDKCVASNKYLSLSDIVRYVNS